MKFRLKYGDYIKGRLLYTGMELDFEPQDKAYKSSSNEKRAALTISKTLQLEFQIADGHLLYVWGYLPQEGLVYEDSSLNVDQARTGQVFVDEIADSLIAGTGYDTQLTGKQAHFFKRSGHLVIGDVTKSTVFVIIADDTLIGLRDDQINSVVLHPRAEQIEIDEAKRPMKSS